MSGSPATTIIEGAVRESRGRLVAFIAARSHDIASAEDALSFAIERALRLWPERGVPASPEAWLLTVGRRRLIDLARARSRQERGAGALRDALAEAAVACAQVESFPDERLRLMLVCAHPAIDEKVRAPLMLQVVLGIDAARIARSFLMKPAAMGQRLARAKAKIRQARIPFTVTLDEAPDRIASVRRAIYAAFGSGWEAGAGLAPESDNLADEAIHLARMLNALAPGDAETLGLLALMLHCRARREARRDEAGNFVPLAAQNVEHWNRPMLEEAEAVLQRASALDTSGPFQLEAAIQSAQAERLHGRSPHWPSILNLYGELVRLRPTPGAWVGYAAAGLHANAIDLGLQILPDPAAPGIADYQPYWTVLGHLLAAAGRGAEAKQAYDRAIALCDDQAVRAFLGEQRMRAGQAATRFAP